MKELTSRQKEVLDFIRAYSKKNECPPTVREVAAYFTFSLKAAQDHISALRKKKYLSPGDNKSRSLRVLVPEETEGGTDPLSQVPILGTVAAGRPLLSYENILGQVDVASSMLRTGKEHFAMRIRGSSMINAGILEGDIAIIEKSETAENGQIIVAVLDESITLKRFIRESTRIRLQPENPDFQPIFCQDVRVAGRLVAIIREY